MENKYSVWQKIDLHIHTDWSKKTKDNDYTGLFSVNTLHDKLSEQDVEIFSLTDHNIINLPAYREYYGSYQDPSAPLLLLGVELDILHQNKTYHSLLIFNSDNIEYAEKINKQLEDRFAEKGLSLKDRHLTIKEITYTFPEDDFFFIPHAGNTASIVDGYKGEIEEAQKMLILLQSPLEKVPEKRRQIYSENFDKVLYEAFRNKDDYAYIEFSDNHNIEKYPCAHDGGKGEHKFYKIKGSKNYETLRLAFIDPKSRIKSPAEHMAISQTQNYVENLDIGPLPHIEGAKLEFSPHLNVIIGGRSSGKSLLMDILNRSIDRLIPSTKYDSIQEGLATAIKSKHDSSPKSKTILDTSIIQINQGDIVSFFENNMLDDLARKTNKLEEYKKAKESLGLEKENLEDLIGELQNQYGEAFEQDLSKNFVVHQHTINKYLSNEYLFKVEIQEIQNSHDSSEILQSNESILSLLVDNLDKFKESQYFTFTDEENALIKNFDAFINSKKESIEKKISLRDDVDEFLEKASVNIQDANATLNTEGQEKAQAQELIKSKISSIHNLFSSLSELQEIAVEVESYEASHREEIELDADINLCLEVRSNDKVKDLILDGIKENDRSSLYLALLDLLYADKAIKNFADNKPDSLSKKTNKNLRYLLDLFVKPIDFLQYEDGSTSKNNSPGYNSEKYLQVILNKASSNLILIDQPEDNLGNKYISEKLVDTIRSLKFQKQMFLVTHNPAIVVYGDAESVILAQNTNNKISYTQIKLESESSQREICSVLDGGQYIFDNRAKKYNIQKLLKAGA